jgi:hypothetical protein
MQGTIWQEGPCAGKLFFVWGVYGWAMTLLWEAVRAEGLPELVSWAIAGVLALGLLLWTEEG